MELQLFIYKNLALHLYYWEDSLSKEKIKVKNFLIYFPGLPQIVNKGFFVDRVSKETAFLSVNYLGSQLSGGRFSYSNCKKSVERAVELAKNKKGIKTFDNQKISWDYDNLIVAGYSFAGNPILTSKISQDDVKKVVLLAPLIFLSKGDTKEYLNKKDFEDFHNFNSFFLGFLKRGYRFAYRGITDRSWNKVFAGNEPSSIIGLNNDYPDIEIYHGRKDSDIPYKSSQYFKKKFGQIKLELIDNADHDLEELFGLNRILNNL